VVLLSAVVGALGPPTDAGGAGEGVDEGAQDFRWEWRRGRMSAERPHGEAAQQPGLADPSATGRALVTLATSSPDLPAAVGVTSWEPGTPARLRVSCPLEPGSPEVTASGDCARCSKNGEEPGPIRRVLIRR
jgi:hypothetical protein